MIKAFSSLSDDPTREVKSIITGESEAKVSFVVDVVRAYRTEKPKKSITEFFNERYREKAMVAVKPKDAIQEAIHGYREASDPRTQK